MLVLETWGQMGSKMGSFDSIEKYWTDFGPPLGKRSYKIAPVSYYYQLVISDPLFSKTALRIFLIFCMKLNTDNGSKVTKPDFGKKFWGSRYWAKRGQNGVFQEFLKNQPQDLVRFQTERIYKGTTYVC